MNKFFLMAGAFMLFSSMNAMENVFVKQTEQVMPEETRRNIELAKDWQIDADPNQKDAWLNRFEQIEEALKKMTLFLQTKTVSPKQLAEALNLPLENVNKLLTAETLTQTDLIIALEATANPALAMKNVKTLFETKTITPEDLIEAFNLKFDASAFKESGLPRTANETRYFLHRLQHDKKLNPEGITTTDLGYLTISFSLLRSGMQI